MHGATIKIINTYVSLMYELKKIGKVFTITLVGTGPSSCKKIIYRAAVSQRLRNTGLELLPLLNCCIVALTSGYTLVVYGLNV